MDKFFNSKSVVVIGVSPRPGNLGRSIVANLELAEYEGDMFLVGPRGGELKGQTIYKDVADLPAVPELAVILTPAATVPALMEACGKKGITRVVVETGGFGELDEGRKDLERALTQTAQRYGMRFVGPNCIGVLNTYSGLAVPFPLMINKIPQGGLSIIAQSGGVGLTYLNAFARSNIGVANFASVGNKLNVNERDLLAHCIDDPHTEIILLYLESIVAGREMMELIAATDKPVVVHKSNIGQISHGIAQSHTSALTNDDAVVDAALQQAGAIRAHTVMESQHIIKGLTLPPLKGRRLALISRSGGHAVVAADAMHREKLELAQFPEEYLAPIREKTRASVIKLQNPLDLGDLFDFNVYVEILRGALAMDQVDGVLFVHGYRGPESKTSREFAIKAGELAKAAGKPVSLVLLIDPEEYAQVLEMTDLPIFITPEHGVTALAAIAPPAPRPDEPEPTALPPLDLARCQQLLDSAGPDGWLSASAALELIKSAGLPVAGFASAASPSEAAQAADALGYPVVLKAAGAGAAHKTEAGGVALNLASAAEVRQAAEAMVQRMGPVDLVVMQQATGEVELIVGGKQDQSFGPVVLCGLGGTAAEATRDVALGIAPLTPAQAGAMWDSLRGARLLKGFRNLPPISRPGLLAVVMRLGELLVALPSIAELDINPMIAGEQQVLAVDARIRVDTEA